MAGRSIGGRAGFDHTQRLVVSYVWMLPSLAHANRFVRGALGAWELSGIATVQSGDPLTVTAGFDRIWENHGAFVANRTKHRGSNCCSSKKSIRARDIENENKGD